MRRPFHLIINPNARSGRGSRIVPALETALDARGLRDRTVHWTAGPGDATRIARGLAEGGGAPGVLVVVGGDGTLHEVVNGLREAGFPEGVSIAVLPVGTGNDFHRMLHMEGSIEGLIEVLEQGEPRPFDVGEVRWAGGEAVFVNLLGVGIDEAVLRRRDSFRKLPGLLQYLAALAATLVDYRPIALEGRWERANRPVATAPDLPTAWQTLLTAVTVGPSIGGGFIVAPEARPDDGALDLLLVEPLSFTEIVRILPSVVRGTLKSTSKVYLTTVTGGRLAAPSGGQFFFELDGERMEDSTPWIEFRILPGVLQVMDRGGMGPRPEGR